MTCTHNEGLGQQGIVLMLGDGHVRSAAAYYQPCEVEEEVQTCRRPGGGTQKVARPHRQWSTVLAPMRRLAVPA